MARMIPPTGPNAATGSPKAEPDIYWRLRKQLPDEFTVIHSIPWLSSVARTIDGRPVPTGELDFLILHPDLGLLAVEVKGGVLGYDRTEFVYLHTGERIDPVRQVRRGTHGLASWLKKQGGVAIKIGYAVFLPHSEVAGRPLPPSLLDSSVTPPLTITVDKRDLQKLGEKVQELMRYWQQVLQTRPPGRARVEKLVDLICPVTAYPPTWRTRIEYDQKRWLELTPEQSTRLDAAIRSTRSVITGWPGTGKTLLAISLARRLGKEQQSTLFLVYNIPLAKELRRQLSDSPKVKVLNFHGLCRQAAQALNEDVPGAGAKAAKSWYRDEAPLVLKRAVQQGALPEYDALIIDETQVFEQEWLRTLTGWMGDKRIAAFCDETQVFEFEKRTPVTEIASIIGAQTPFTLTVNMRSPRAVFDRLEQILTSAYQQHNPRPFEPDTLLELAVHNPADELSELLGRLKSEKVSAREVTVLYHKQGPPDEIPSDDYPVTVESIARFRGLESPVIIVYAPDSIDDITLFCAYSRATSRCIVIYSAYNITKGACGTFGNILLQSERGQAIRQAAAAGSTTGIVSRLSLSVERVVSHAGRVDWCHDWGAWVIPAEEGTAVTASLWLDHLSLVTSEPIYFWAGMNRGGLYRCKAGQGLSEDLHSEPMLLDFCESCWTVTPHTMWYGSPDACALCESPDNFPAGEPPETQDVAGCDEMLSSSDKVPADRKRQLPLTIIALGRWMQLKEEQRDQLAEALLHAGGTIGYHVALALTGTDIIKAAKGVELNLDKMAKRYYSWSTWTSERLAFDKWRAMVGPALSRWKQRGLIDSRGKGVFYRL